MKTGKKLVTLSNLIRLRTVNNRFINGRKGIEQIAIHEQIIYRAPVRDDHPGGDARLYYRLLPDGIGRNAFEELCKVHNLYAEAFSINENNR
ncbi:MAG: hypothetical protein IPF62_04340 [Bacteroidetes bacterium]|nr:hypothetical protein [Bacteroidota bacterium]